MNNILWLTFILVVSFRTSAAPTCESFFLTKKEFRQAFDPEVLSKKQSKKMLESTVPEKKAGSTTADRAEFKFTLTKESMLNKIRQFKKAIELEIANFTLVNRDVLTAGFKNVTYTAYSNRFKLTLKNGEKLTAKIRVRKYGLIANELEVSKENFNAIESMKDISFFEFKIENPDFDNSVLKPRMKIKDSDADALLNPNLTKDQYAEIRQRCIELNKMDSIEKQTTMEETITLMLAAIRGIHKKESFFAPEYETIYERVSYKIPLKDLETGKSYEVQITLDDDISATSVGLNYTTPMYSSQIEKVTVGEVKLPVPLLQLLSKGGNAADLQQLAKTLRASDFERYPGLNAVMNLLQSLSFNGLKNFQENHGKLFHLRQSIQDDFKP